MANRSPTNAGPGPAVDAFGQPAVDPTQNVLDLVNAAMRRQDDLRESESRHIREIIAMQADHSRQMRQTEAARIDAIRAVDVGAVQRAAEVSQQQASTLAAQVALSAEAVRVALAAAMEPIQKDIADLRRAQYEAQGVRTNVGEVRQTQQDVRQTQRDTSGQQVLILGIVVSALLGMVSLIMQLIG